MTNIISERVSALAVAAGHVFEAHEAAQDGYFDVLLAETIEALDNLEGCQAMMKDDEPDALRVLQHCRENCACVIVNVTDDEDEDLDAVEETLRVTGGLILGVANAITTGNWDEFVSRLSSTIPAIHAANSCMEEAKACMEAVWPNEEALEGIEDVLHENNELIDCMLQNIDWTDVVDVKSPASTLLDGAESLLGVLKDIEDDAVNFEDEELVLVLDSIQTALAGQLDALHTVHHPETDLDLDIFSWDYITGRCDEAVV